MNTELKAPEKTKVDALAPSIPKIAIIQGKGGFGELHRQAVKYALQPITPTKAFCLDCEQSLADIKLGRPDPCMDQLRKWLDNQDVVAVVGPSATEATRLIIDTINDSGYRVPVFATSAAPRTELQWQGVTIPVFRISSGIDERAEELAKLTHYLVDHEIHVLFLVEHNRNTNVATYGEHLENSIRKLDPDYWEGRLNNGSVSRLEYETGHIDNNCNLLNTDVRKKQIIFLLGIGDDFSSVVSQCYASGNSIAKLLGFMNAYAINPSNKTSQSSLANVFEITDLDLSRIEGGDRPPATSHFEDKFGPLTPAVRDQAFSYDVGTILLGALDNLHKATSANPTLKYRDALTIMTNAIERTDLNGMTGHIQFDTKQQGTHLQNVLTKLALTRYDANKRKWVVADKSELLRFRP